MQGIVAVGMEISLDNNIIAALVLMMFLAITFMLYNFHRARMATAANNVQKEEKEPQEHDERFETSKLSLYEIKLILMVYYEAPSMKGIVQTYVKFPSGL